jgi:hypothetical protein
MLVAGLKQQPRLDIQHAVAADECPSAAARQYRAFEFRAIEVAALEPRDTSDAMRRIAENGEFKIEIDREEVLGLNLGLMFPERAC